MGAALAVVAAVAVATGAVMTLALKALSSERRAGEQKARADSLDVNLTSLASQLADVTTKCREEKERADRADETIAQLLAEMATRDATGSYQRLLQIIAAAKGAAAGRDSARGVSATGSADRGSDWDLLKPGD